VLHERRIVFGSAGGNNSPRRSQNTWKMAPSAPLSLQRVRHPRPLSPPLPFLQSPRGFSPVAQALAPRKIQAAVWSSLLTIENGHSHYLICLRIEIRAQAVRYVPERDAIEIVTNRNAGFLIPRQWIGALQDVPTKELRKLEV
jgi:hypothetical protein